MKKIFSFILALMMSVMLASAQTVEQSTFFENTAVTVYGGAITTQHTGGETFFWGGAKNIVKGIRPVAGIELTKYVTPVVGFGIEGLAMFNTTGSNTVVDQSNLVANLKLNLSNWIGGYPGQPRRVEVVLVPGLGWGHDFGDVYNDRNYMTYNAGAELNINLGQQRAWQINVKPVVMWNNYGTPEGNPFTPTLHHMQGRLQIGITYKFGSRIKKSHNFVVCPYTVTEETLNAVIKEGDVLFEEVNALQAKVKELENREPKVVEKTVVVERYAPREPSLTTVLTFAIGSDKLSSVEAAKLGVLGRTIKSDETVILVGSADTSTGSEQYNYELAARRANAVRDILVNQYGIAPGQISTDVQLDTNELPAASRAVVITLK